MNEHNIETMMAEQDVALEDEADKLPQPNILESASSNSRSMNNNSLVGFIESLFSIDMKEFTSLLLRSRDTTTTTNLDNSNNYDDDQDWNVNDLCGK